MIRLTAVVVFVLLANSAFSQTAGLSGTVVDDSGAAVPGATVTLGGPGAPPPAISGGRGEFSFRNLASGTYELTVALVGFSTATRRGLVVGESNVEIPTITLAIAPLADLIVVSASRTESQLVNAPATMTVLSSRTLATAPALNFGDLLRSVPGLNVIQLSARDVNLTSRQATSTLSNSELVLVDGRSTVLDFFGMVVWDFLPTNLSDIKQIEIIRGPASAVWGSDALAGTVNIITKTPRESLGTTVTLSGGLFSRDAGSTAGRGPGAVFGANASVAEAPNSRWSYRISAGYFNSDSLPRPTGQIPHITDPRDPSQVIGGALYPVDGPGAVGAAFQNTGTSQPKFDVRVDEEAVAGGRLTYTGGVAGTEGLIHTGLGPFDIQSGSYMGYGKVGYTRKALKLNFFTNIVDAQAPSLLLNDPVTGKPVQLNFKTQTYDVEFGDSVVTSTTNLVTFGGNVRRNNFNVVVAPTAQDRTELGAYVQDELIFTHVRFTIGGRVDKFGNISEPVFSPRLTATFKPAPDHAFRVSYNKAFRSPSMINNYEDIQVVVATDLSELAPLLPPSLRPAVAAPFPLVVRTVGSMLPVGTTPQQPLTEESLTAYEVAYTGTFRDRTTLTGALYVNRMDNSIRFTQLPSNLDPYTADAPPPGWPLPNVILSALAQQGIFLPRTAFTYLNLGPIRQKGLELSVDHRLNNALTASVNYSWQGNPTVLPSTTPYPLQKLDLPPTHRFNIGFNFDGTRLLGSTMVSYTDRAFWDDVLSTAFYGFSDPYTTVNAAFGIKWPRYRMTTDVKVTNLFNADIQQHVFGDILKRAAVAEVQFRF